MLWNIKKNIGRKKVMKGKLRNNNLRWLIAWVQEKVIKVLEWKLHNWILYKCLIHSILLILIKLRHNNVYDA